MGRGKRPSVLGASAGALILLAGMATAAPGWPSELDPDPLLPPGKAPAASTRTNGLPPAGASQPPSPLAGAEGRGVLAAVGEALGAVASGIAGLAGGIAGALGGAVGALLGGLGALLGAIAAGLAWLLGAAGGALLGALQGLAAALAGAAGGAAQRPHRLLTPAGGAAVAWALHAMRAPLLALYSRLERHELLDHEARRRIFEFVRTRPGAHVSQVSETLGLGWGTTVYHLQRLRDASLLSARTIGNQLCHFVNGDAHSPDEQRALAATKAPKVQAIVGFLKLRGPSTQHVIAAELGMSSALVSWHAKRLEALGVVERARRGRESVLQLRAPAAAVARPAGVVRALPAPVQAPAPAQVPVPA